MAMNNDYLNEIADHGATLVTHVALADTGDELSGGDYARQAVTWSAATDGNISATNTPTFDVPAGATVNQVMFYSAVTGGTAYGATSVTSETFSGAGTYTLSSAAINHNAA